MYKYRPIAYFSFVTFSTWAFGFMAAYASYCQGMEIIQLLGMFLGLLSPFLVALIMIYWSDNKDLQNDFWDRLKINKVKLKFMPIILLLMPIVLIAATSFSVLLGQPIEQFNLSKDFKVWNDHVILGLMFLSLAPLLEEFGWRGYGVDSLRAYFNLFNTSAIFACLWALWHLPLFFIKGYYQHSLWQESVVYVVNFFASIFPVTFLLNWVFYKNNRSIISAFLFHFSLNLFSVLLQTEQLTKCMVTILLTIVSFVIILKDKRFFFN